MATQKRIEHINIHLLKAEIKEFKDAIPKEKNPRQLKANTNVLPGGVLFYEVSKSPRTGWRSFLEPGFGSTLPAFPSQHSSAVLFFKSGTSSFAVTFGYGRKFLKESALQPDFGLRTALNICNPDTLRAVNFRTIEEKTKIGRYQLSDAGSINAFSLNTDTDLLRGLEADSKDKSVCERLGARWSNLIVDARIEITDLPALAKKLLRYRKQSLPSDYQWVEQIRLVNDRAKKDQLDTELEKQINSGSYKQIRLAIPEIAGSTVGILAKLFEADGIDFSSSIKTYLVNRPKQGQWTVSAAKNSHCVILVDSSSGAERQSVSVYDCLVAELTFQNDLYLLCDGDWFRLERDFVDEVNKALSKIQTLTHTFPKWQAGQSETLWNSSCKNCKGVVCLDKSNIPYGGSYSKIEPADLLTDNGRICHAKRIDRNSSGLSHLFSQGLVAARVISRSPEYRKKVTDILPGNHKGLAGKLGPLFKSSDWTIAYVLLGADGKRPVANLPFFSKVNLKGCCEQLRDLQYNIGLIGV